MLVDPSEFSDITGQILAAAIEVHRELGPGLLESAYEACLLFELLHRGLRVQRPVPMPVTYRGSTMDCGFRIDLLVEGEVLVEVKAIERIAPIHPALLLCYLRLSTRTVGLLINFNVKWLATEGIKRVVNNFPE